MVFPRTEIPEGQHGKISPAAGFMIICCCPAGFSERISEPGLDLEQRFSCSLFSEKSTNRVFQKKH
jgi:hypothetical protein